MVVVDLLEAKSTLSRLVESVETGKEKEVIIARNGRPVARLVPIDASAAGVRIGLAKGRYEIPDDIDRTNAEVEALLRG